MIESDNMTETCDEHPGRRMLADDYVIDLCDFSSTTISEDAVRPKRDMDAEMPIDNEIENDAVRPKCDDDAAKSAVDDYDECCRQTSRKVMQMTEQQQQKQDT